MSEKRELTCINCPLGCQMTATIENGVVIEVSGNTCPRGKKYAERECVAPVRTVTSTVPVEGGGRVSVKTVPEIPKDMIFPVMEEIRRFTASRPVKIGDVLIGDILGTGSKLVASSASRGR